MKTKKNEDFAWQSVLLFCLGIICVTALNICEQHRLIDRETEGIVRLLINSVLGTTIVVMSLRAPITQSLRFAIIFVVVMAVAETLLSYTEDVPAWSDIALLGRNSEARKTLESVLSAGWMIGMFAIVYLSIRSIAVNQRDLKDSLAELRVSEKQLRDTNEQLAATNLQLESTLNELRETQQMLVSQERLSAVGQMTSAVAHELGNALTPVSTYLSMLSEANSELGSREREWISAMRTSASDMSSVIKGLQLFYRKEDSTDEDQSVELEDLSEQVIAATRPRWKDEPERAGKVIDIDRSYGDCSTVRGNPGELRLVLTNLVFNAVDAMPDGGTIGLKIFEHQSQAVIAVSDNGSGMPDNDLRHCFEPFFTTKENGTGLGLSICHGIIGRHGGRIDVQSAPGAGTTFTVRLPCGSGLAPEAPQAANGEDLQKTTEHPSILLVDDDHQVRSSLTAYLQSLGAEVTAAEDGEAAIAFFRQGRRFHWLITDLGMQGTDGVAVVQQVRSMAPKQKIAVISGWSQKDVRARFLNEEEPDLILPKPPDPEALEEVLGVRS